MGLMKTGYILIVWLQEPNFLDLAVTKKVFSYNNIEEHDG